MKDIKKPYTVNGEKVTLEEYRKTKFEDLRLRVPKGKKDVIKTALDKMNEAKETKESLNRFIYDAIQAEFKNRIDIDIDEFEAIPIEWEDTEHTKPTKFELKKIN